MKDIIPYTTEDAMQIGGILAKFQIPSIGPGAAISLLKTADGIRRVMNDEKLKLDKETKTVLEGIYLRFIDVATISGGQQREILETFSRLVKRGT